MKDSWCGRTISRNGTVVYGGAARNVRIAAAGGMDSIIAGAVGWAFEQAEQAVRKGKPKLRLVKAA